MSNDLKKYVNKDVKNIAELLDEEELTKIGKRVLSGYEEDRLSMTKWLDAVEQAIRLASLDREPKNTPYPNSANVKFPLITNACFQFAANIYPEIIKDGKVVKAAVLGEDYEGTKAIKARNVSDYMSYQLLFQSTAWESGLDKLLNLLPSIGFLVKKTYYDTIKQENCSELCDYKDIIINSDAKSLSDASRITHILHFRLNDLVSQSRAGIFLEDSVMEIYNLNKDLDLDKHIDCLEQHRLLDLDDDGFEEPYIVTVEASTGKVLRIYPRFELSDVEKNSKGKIFKIKPCKYFTDFHFLPNPNGSFLSIGFGTLMLHLNESINTILNQLMDAGKLRNMQGGYIDSRIKLNSGSSRHSPGEWQRVKPVAGQILKDGFMPINYQEPSNVLFQLLGMLVQAGKELSSSTEAMQGSAMPDNAKTGAVANLIDRGLKVFNAIQRRVYRSLKDEYQKLFELNAKYMDVKEYMTVLDSQKAVYRDDFDIKSVDVMPVADPNLSSDSQRFSQIQVLQNIKQTNPQADMREIDLRTLEFARVQSPEKILPPPPPNPPQPPESIKLQAELIKAQQDAHHKDVELQQEQQRIDMEKELHVKEMAKIDSEIMKNIAQAESFPVQHQFQDLELQLKMLTERMGSVMQMNQMQHEKDMQSNQLEADQNAAEQQGTTQGMAPTPNDQAVPESDGGAPPVQ